MTDKISEYDGDDGLTTGLAVSGEIHVVADFLVSNLNLVRLYTLS